MYSNALEIIQNIFLGYGGTECVLNWLMLMIKHLNFLLKDSLNDP